MEKSHVGLGHHICPVCGIPHDEMVLIDKYLRSTLTSNEFVGWELCSEHATQQANGYVFLVELSSQPADSSLSATWSHRTGQYVALKKEVAKQLFGEAKEFAFCDTDLIPQLQEMICGGAG